MRHILVASLFLSTALLNAQSIAKGQGAVLEAHNVAPAPLASDVVAAHPRRVSTGVTAPKLISMPTVRVSTTEFPGNVAKDKFVVVHFTVDEKGTPKNVKLVKSVNQVVDARILATVGDYRFSPATLNEQAVAQDMNLTVKFEQK
jgi:TonB family protein